MGKIDRNGPDWAQDIPNVRPVMQRRLAMRRVSFILFSAIALASSAPSAFAAENALGRASLSSATCPVNEGYPDCHADGRVPFSVYSSSRRSLNCYNPYIGNWKHGYPRDDDSC
jgi:hypothetical protein